MAGGLISGTPVTNAILDGGMVAPGISLGTLPVNVAFTLADTTILNFEFDAANNTVGGGIKDLIAGVTKLALDGVLDMTGSGDWTHVADYTSWRVINCSGTLTDNGLSISVKPTFGICQSLPISAFTAGEVNLGLGPEPSGVPTAALGIAWAAWREIQLACAGGSCKRRNLVPQLPGPAPVQASDLARV